MAFLKNKRILITGLISERSIAYGIANACHEQGADLAFTYVNERFRERVTEMAAAFGSNCVLPLDVTQDIDIENCMSALSKHWDRLDGLVHSIAFAQREAIAGSFLDGLSRKNFLEAHDISAYSFPALAKAALPLLRGPQGNNQASLLSLTYLGAERVVPHYNTMGVAKAALEASVRYLATAVGEYGIRANAISAGPIRTLAASGIKGFPEILRVVEENAPLKRNVNIHEVGNVAAFLLSDLASAITAEVTYVDCGFNAVMSGARV